MSTLYPRSVDVNRSVSQSPYTPATYAEINSQKLCDRSNSLDPQLDKRILPLFSLISMAYMFPWTAIGALVTYFTNVYGAYYYTLVNIAFYSVGLPLALLQLKYDENYDTAFGSIQAFKFRLLFAFILMICILLLMPLSEYYSFIFLVMLLSVCTWAIHGTISNLAALVQYNSSTYQQIGFNLPVLLSLALTFTIIPTDEFSIENAFIFYGIQAFFMIPAIIAIYILLGTSSPSSDFVKHKLTMKDKSYSVHFDSNNDSDDEYENENGNNKSGRNDDITISSKVSNTEQKKYDDKVYNQLHAVEDGYGLEEGKDEEEVVGDADGGDFYDSHDDGENNVDQGIKNRRKKKKKQPLMASVMRNMYQHIAVENLHKQQQRQQRLENVDRPNTTDVGREPIGYNPPPIPSIHISSTTNNINNIYNSSNSNGYDNVRNPMLLPVNDNKVDKIDNDVESNNQNNNKIETDEKIALLDSLDRTSLDSMRVYSKSVFDENQASSIFVDEAVKLRSAISPHCRALAAVIFASILQASLLSQVESTSGMEIGSVLYYTRMFADLLGRPLSIYRSEYLNSIHSIEIISYFRLATVVLFVLYVKISLPIKDDYAIISYQFIFSMMSGYLVCLVYEDASMLFTNEGKRTQGLRLLNLAFQGACFVAVLCSATIVLTST